MKVYTFQLPKFISSMTRTCLRWFTKQSKEKK